MISICPTNKIIINSGYLDIINSNSPFPSLTFRKKELPGVMVSYPGNSTTDISVRSDETHYVNFKLDISTLNDCYIHVELGAIKIEAVSSQLFINSINAGAIVLCIKEAQIGALYMKVNTGIIISNNTKVKISPLIYPRRSHGAEAHFKGKLQGQHTELLLGSGAIVCNIVI